MSYVSLMVTTKQKPVIDPQKDKGIKTCHHKKSSSNKEKQQERNKGNTKQSENNEQNGITKFLPTNN